MKLKNEAFLQFLKLNTDSNKLISFFGSTVAAGFPSPAQDHVEKKIDLNEELITHPVATFFVKVVGSSMEDANIYEGDILIVDKALNASDGKIIVASIDGEFTVKRLRIKNGKTFLQPENPTFPAIELNSESKCQVWGVVTYIIHKAI